MARINASIPEGTLRVIQEIADEEKRSLSSAVRVILTKVAAQWILDKPKPKFAKSPKK